MVPSDTASETCACIAVVDRTVYASLRSAKSGLSEHAPSAPSPSARPDGPITAPLEAEMLNMFIALLFVSRVLASWDMHVARLEHGATQSPQSGHLQCRSSASIAGVRTRGPSLPVGMSRLPIRHSQLPYNRAACPFSNTGSSGHPKSKAHDIDQGSQQNVGRVVHMHGRHTVVELRP